MLQIGVIGDLFVYKTTDILKLLYKDRPEGNMASIITVCIDERREHNAFQNKFDILIINNNMKKQSQKNLLESGVFSEVAIINSDEKNIYKALSCNRIITYGLNSRACVTASSVSENSVLFCIQRALRTLSGNTVEQQEFSITVNDTEDDIHSILAAVTSALVGDFTIEKICACLQ